MNDILHPLLPRVEGPSNVRGNPVPDSSMGSSDPDGVQERNNLVARLEATEVVLQATEGETSAAQAKLAEADAIVAGEPFLIPRKDLIYI